VPRRDALRIAVVWAVWLGAILVTVAVGLGAGAYTRRVGWTVGRGLWPLFAWDFNWYRRIAESGYPTVHSAREYAFFPLWPLLIRWSSSIPDAVAAAALAWPASAVAFLGVAGGLPRERLRSALALACWPGSFALLLAYPDALALAAAAWAAALAVRGRFFSAGLSGAVAALARPDGFLIALPLAWLGWRHDRRSGLYAMLPAAAAAAVEGYFWDRSGNARVFVDAQRLWGRNGPSRVGDWAHHLGTALDRHALLIGLLVLCSAAALVLAWRQRGPLPTAIGAYACAVAVALTGTKSLGGLVDSFRAGLVLPLLVVLWRLGERYRPWAAYATLVVVLLFLSGVMQSFGRESLYAFPIFWAIADGPPLLRKPVLAGLGFAANLGLVLLLTRFAA
jgi:hypothetical protein